MKNQTLKQAVRSMCFQCMGGETCPGVREQIRGCTAKACPLFPWRPYRYAGELTPLQAACAGRTGGYVAKSDAPSDPDDSDDSEEG